MQESKTYIGTIKMFNGQYGFIKSDLGDTYFHRSSVSNKSSGKINVGALISFNLEPSPIKKGSFQGVNITIVENANTYSAINKNYIPENLGKVEWFDERGFGVIKNEEGEYFFHYSSILIKPDKIYKEDICAFNIQPSKKSKDKTDAIGVIFLKNYPAKDRLEEVIASQVKKIGCVDDDNKYRELLGWLSLIKPKPNAVELFNIETEDRYKYLLWKNEYTKDVNLSKVAQELISENSNWHYLALCKELFARLSETETPLVLNELISIIKPIDTSEKYNKIKAILMLESLPQTPKTEFLSLAFDHCDSGRKYLLWLEGFIEHLDINLIASILFFEISKQNFQQAQKIFSRLTDDTLLHVLNILLSLTGKIDSSEKYIKFLNILNILKNNKLNDSSKSEFIATIYENSDSERKYLLWLEGYVENVDLELIISKLTIENAINASTFYQILGRLNGDQQDIVLKGLSLTLGKIDSESKYSIIKRVLSSDKINNPTRLDFYNFIIKNCNIASRLKIFNDFGGNDEYNIELATKDALDSKNRVSELYQLFEYLKKNSHDELNWIEEFLLKLNVSERLAFLQKASVALLLKPLKNKYFGIPLIKLIRIDASYVIGNLHLFPTEFHHLIKSYYFSPDRYKEIVDIIVWLMKNESLSKDNILDYYRGISLSSEIDIQEELMYISSYKELENILFKNDNIDLYKEIVSIIFSNNNYPIQSFLSDEVLFNVLKCVGYIDRSTLEEMISKEFSSLSNLLLLKLWVHDLSSYFDFNLFCYYYFALNSIEKIIFNKKVKTVQGEALKQSMLKQRVPWEFDSKDEESNLSIYLATWKSIWFGDGKIRFCCDNEANFSNYYSWDFSEEKFNLLFDYISGRRLSDLIVHVKNNFIVSVSGLEELEEVIWKVQIQREIDKGEGMRIKSDLYNRIPVNMILRNQCIQLLNKLQLVGLEPTRILENTLNVSTGKTLIDISLLYSIPLNKNEIALIWESLELDKSKATHIFKCAISEYNAIFSDVEFYLQSRNKVRSTLNSSDSDNVKLQRELRYLCRIDHDNFDYSKWENNLFCELPELKDLEIPAGPAGDDL